MGRSAGNAEKEMSIITESIDYKLNALKETGTGIAQNLFNRRDIGIAVDTLTLLLNVIDKVTQSLGLFGTAFVLGGGISKFVSAFKETKDVGQSLFAILPSWTKGVDAFNLALFDGASKGQAAIQGLMAAFDVSPLMLKIAAVTAVVAGLVFVFYKLSNAAKEANEAMRTEFTEFEDAKKQVENLNSELDSTKEKIAKLETKGGLTLVEKSELNKLKEAQKSLEKQKDIAEKKAEAEARQSASATVAAYKKNFNKEISQAATESYLAPLYSGKYGSESEYMSDLISDPTNISSMIAGIKEYTKARDKATDPEVWESYNNKIVEATSSIWEQASTLSEYKTKLEAVGYDKLTDNQRTALSNITSQIDYIYQELDPETWKQWKLDEIMDNDVFENAKKNLIDIAKESNNVGISIEDVRNQSEHLFKTLGDKGLLQDFVDSINSEAGIIDFKQIKRQLLNSFTTFNTNNADRSNFATWIGKLSDEDLKLVYQISLDTDTAEYELADWMNALEHYKATKLVVPVEIETEISGYQKVSSAIKANASDIGLLEENITDLTDRYSSLKSFDAATLFINSASGVRLNTDELQRLETQQERIIEQKFEQTIKDEEEELQRLLKRTEDLTDADETQKKQLKGLIDAQKDKLNTLKQLRAMYQGLTSDYSKMLKAQETENSGAMYDNIKKAYDSAKELRKQGLVGTDDFTSFVQLMTFDDISLKTPYEIADIFDSFSKKIPGLSYSVSDFFKDGQKGAENFLKAVEQAGKKTGETWASYDSKTKSWKFDFGEGEAGIKKLAQTLGVSVEFIESMLGKLSDFGFHIDLDESVDTLEDLKYKVRDTEAALESLGQKPYKITCDTNSVESINQELINIENKKKEIDNSPLSPKVKDAQIADLKAKYQMLLAQIDELNSSEISTSIDTSTVDGAMTVATNAIEKYNSAAREAATNKALGLDTSEAEAKMKSCASELAGIANTDVKAKIGIEESDDSNAVLSKLENNTVKIPTEVEKPDTAEVIGQIESKDATITVKADGKEEVEQLNDSINKVINSANTNVNVVANVIGGDEVESLASAIEKVHDKNVSVTANVTGDSESKTLSDSINSIKGKNVKVKADVTGQNESKTLSDSIQKVKGKTVQVKANVKGEEKAVNLADSIQKVENKSVEVSVTSNGDESVKTISDSITNIKSKTVMVSVTTIGKSSIDSVKTAFNTLKNKAVTITTNVAGSGLIQKLKDAIDTVKNKTVQVKANVSGTGSVNSLASAIHSVYSKTVTVTAKTVGLSDLQTMKSYYDSLKDKTVTVTMKANNNGTAGIVDGTAHAQGTANAQGSAFAGGTSYSRGDWRIGRSGVSLGGELGPEILVSRCQRI